MRSCNGELSCRLNEELKRLRQGRIAQEQTLAAAQLDTKQRQAACQVLFPCVTSNTEPLLTCFSSLLVHDGHVSLSGNISCSHCFRQPFDGHHFSCPAAMPFYSAFCCAPLQNFLAVLPCNALLHSPSASPFCNALLQRPLLQFPSLLQCRG